MESDLTFNSLVDSIRQVHKQMVASAGRAVNVSSTGKRQLYNYLALYCTYPEIMRTVPAQLGSWIPDIQDLLKKVYHLSQKREIR